MSVYEFTPEILETNDDQAERDARAEREAAFQAHATSSVLDAFARAEGEDVTIILGSE